MRTIVIAAVLALAAAPTALAGPSPTAADRAAAVNDCRILRSAPPAGMGLEAFRETYGTNANRMNAFGRCVRRMVAAEHANRHEAERECRAERGTTPESRAAFREKYGSLGRCIRANRREESAEDRERIMNAAETCREERGTTDESRAAFNEEYGTNENDRNAFGKCVSRQARAQNDDD